MIDMLFTARYSEPFTGKRRRRMAEEEDLFAFRGCALASLWGPQTAAGHHTAEEANAQQATKQAATDQSAGQAATDQAAADQAAADPAAADQAAEQEAADQEAAVQAAADTQQVKAQHINCQATAAHTSVIQQMAAGVGDGHQSSASQTAARSFLDTAPESPLEAAGMYSQALTVKALPSTSSEAMLSGHTGLPASVDLRAFPDGPLSTGQQRQQHRAQSTRLSGWLERTSFDSAIKSGADILAETHDEGAANAEQIECMGDRAASAIAASATASATALPATTIASATASETTPPADGDTAAPALKLAGVATMAPTLSLLPHSLAQVGHISAL